MEQACAENLAVAERGKPFAENKVLEAHDALTAWVESMGKLEEEKRKRTLVYWKEQVTKHREDMRYWRERGKAWRECMALHPELGTYVVGAKCIHGYIAPMCVVDQPEIKREREPGDDDDEEAA
jgi:hypothetical protein